jgi:hypothetical protein
MYIRLHGVTSQETVIYTVAAVRMSDLTHELHDLQFLRYIIKMFKSRNVKLMGHVESVGWEASIEGERRHKHEKIYKLFLRIWRNWDSVVDIVTRLRGGPWNRGLIPDGRSRFLSSPKNPDWLCNSPSLAYKF